MHEYGGGAALIHDGVVYFSNFDDQRLYRLQAGEAVPLPVGQKTSNAGSMPNLIFTPFCCCAVACVSNRLDVDHCFPCGPQKWKTLLADGLTLSFAPMLKR